jgi:hypothetical protein
LRLFELGALVLAALFALAFHARLPGKQVAEADYLRVAQVLAQERAPGDVVLLFPWWTERARLFVPDGLPVVGYLVSDGDELVAHPRIWVLGQPQQPKADKAAFEKSFLPGRTALGTTREFGNLELTLYRNDRHRPVLFSAVDAFASARVYLERPGAGRVDCPFDGRAHRCPGPGNLYVAPEWHELKFVPRRCLWMHPPGGDARLVAEFPQVPVGSRLRLEGGIIWEHAPRNDASITTTNIGVEELGTNRRVVDLAIPPALESMQRLEVPGAGLSSPAGLKLWVASANPEARELCVDLSSLGPSAAEGP